MSGLERYNELMAAQGKVVSAMDAIMTSERLSPAWYKACRISQYLQKQAAHVMEGLTEDGKEDGGVWALWVLLLSLGSPVSDLIADGDVASAVGMVMSANGYSQDEAEDIEERMAPQGCWKAIGDLRKHDRFLMHPEDAVEWRVERHGDVRVWAVSKRDGMWGADLISFEVTMTSKVWSVGGAL